MKDTSQPSDGELLAVFAGTNDEAAFAELIGRHGAMVQGVCLRVLGNFHEAQDVTQAVFVTLARKAASLRKDPSVGGWLHHVAICLARNVRAANHSRQRREEQAMHEIEVSAEPCVVDTHALRAELDDAIGRLPERYRLPLVLFHLEERSLEQTAQALALNIKTASTRLVRGREMLRKKLIRRGVTAGAIGALIPLLSPEAGAVVLPATFVSATVQAASLAATGQLATGVGTGVVSAKVAALAKGAIQMMFIAQLKTAALITAACVVVAGSGVIVAKEMLTPPSAPVSAQAEPKIPPPAPATNAAATIASGAGLQLVAPETTPAAVTVGVTVSGRETIPGAFEPGETVEFHCHFVNGTADPVIIKQRPAPGELLYTITGPDKKDRQFDAVADWHERWVKNWAGAKALTTAYDREFSAIPPGKSAPLSAWVGLIDEKGDLIYNEGVRQVPTNLVARPGFYEVRVCWRNADRRGWAGELVSMPVRFEVLSEERVRELEKGLALTRLQAEQAALSAAQEYFKNPPEPLKGLHVSEPFRLFVQGGKKFWRVEYCLDNGLTARWVIVLVDGETGKVTTERSTKRGA